MDKVKEDGDFDYGSNILFLNTDKYIENIESENPYVKVEQIIRYFPNTLRVYISERVPKYRIVDTDNSSKWYILDEDFKILDKVTTDELSDPDVYPASDETLNYYDLTVEVEGVSIKDGTIGEFVSMNDYGEYITNIFSGIYGVAEDYTIAKTVSIESVNDVLCVTITMRNSNASGDDTGGKICVFGTDDLVTKVFTGIDCYDNYVINHQTSSDLDITKIKVTVEWSETEQAYEAIVTTSE